MIGRITIGGATAMSVGAMLLWGAAYVPSAWLVDAWPPLVSAGARLAVAGVVLLGALVALGRPVAPAVGLGAVAWLALTQSVLFYGATFWGIAHAGAGLAAVLANTDPLFVAALATLLLGERLGRVQWLGLTLGLLGAAVVVWEGPVWPLDLSTDAMVVVGGAVAWSLGTIVASRSVRGTADPLALAAWQMVLGGAVLMLAGALTDRSGLGDTGPAELALVLALGVAGSAAPLALFYLALARAPATEVSAWFFLIPVIGVLSAWPLLGEEPTGRLVVGLVGVSLGLWLVLGRRDPAKSALVDSAPPS